MSQRSTAEQLRDPDYTPPLHVAVPLGIQHVLAMFVSNFTPAIIIGLAAGYSFGSPDLVYMIQIAMLFSGIATLIQTVGIGPAGARLPIMQGTSFAFIPVMIPAVKTVGMAGLFGGILVGSVIHTLLGFFWSYAWLVAAARDGFDCSYHWSFAHFCWHSIRRRWRADDGQARVWVRSSLDVGRYCYCRNGIA